MHAVHRLLVISALAAVLPAPGVAQKPGCTMAAMPTVDVADTRARQLRTAQLDGTAPLSSLTIRTASSDRALARCPAAESTQGGRGSWYPALTLLPVRMRSIYNSAYPLNVNTGALWAGRGASGTVEAGAELRVGPLTATLYPLAGYQENADFAIRGPARRGASEFAYSGHPNIDWPQRHGDRPFRTLHPGQSSIRIEGLGLSAGFSTENMWIGPAQRMPLMMSNTGPGFPHLFARTQRPLDLRIGTVEANVFWGRLTESDYLDGLPENDRRLLVGATAVFQPVFLPGLYLGAHRSWIVPWEQPEWRALDYLVQPFTDLRGNPRNDNKLFSLFARWVLTPAEFEVYAEWGREDGWGEWMDFIREPDHSQVYMLGLQKLTHARGATLRWWGELAHLESALPLRGGRGVKTMYTHNELFQGYTHRGQLLGAWIGPGSDAQIVGLERIGGERVSGVALERVRFDANAYYDQWARFYGPEGHDVALSLWLTHTEPLPWGLQLAAAGSATRRQNRNFVHLDGSQPADIRWETNAHVDVELRWMPPW